MPDSIKTALEKPLIFVEVMPEYPGGDQAMMDYFSKSIVYPEVEDVQGSVIVNFVIDTTGKVTSTKILRSVHPLFDAEALRVVGAMPTWKAGTQQGKKVNVQYNLPIRFAYNAKKSRKNHKE
jgi:TonB family protein